MNKICKANRNTNIPIFKNVESKKKKDGRTEQSPGKYES